MLEFLDAAKKAAVPIKYVLFDIWFSSQSTLHAENSKVVYVRNCGKREEYLCFISTDISLDEKEIIRIYGKRWDIEGFFKACKSYLNLSRECNALSYYAMTEHTATVFTRYMMLSLESRESNDK